MKGYTINRNGLCVQRSLGVSLKYKSHVYLTYNEVAFIGDTFMNTYKDICYYNKTLLKIL